MKALHRRVLAAGERVAGLRVATAPEIPAMEQWADILRRVRPILEASDDPAAPPAVARVHRTLALVAEALASGRPWAYLEYDCHSCVLRMHWPGFVPANLDPDYERHISRDRGHRAGESLLDSTDSIRIARVVKNHGVRVPITSTAPPGSGVYRGFGPTKSS